MTDLNPKNEPFEQHRKQKKVHRGWWLIIAALFAVTTIWYLNSMPK